MKAQSAIEYLMTYGWMLLVVAVAGGSIYSVSSSQCTETVNGFSSQALSVTDFTVSSETDNLVVLLENNGADTITLGNMTVISEDGNVEVDQNSTEISPGESLQVQLAQGFAPSQQCNTYDMEISYDAGGLQGVMTSGSITGGIQTVNVPEAPEIENVAQ